MTPETKKAWGLLAVAVVFWGVNWPVMKLGLEEIGPLWFAAVRVLIATGVLFVVVAARGRLHRPARAELPMLFSVGVVQLGGCMALLHSSLLYVDAGMASVLAYTTPIWVAPLAAAYLGERMTGRKVGGIALGVAGVAVLFAPALPAIVDGAGLGALMPLGSALLWATVIVHIRRHGWTRPHLSLLPWQMTLGGGVLTAAALLNEGVPVVDPTARLLGALAFNGLLATALAFWAYIGAARALPATTTAVASLAIPVIGVMSSRAVLDEPITLNVVAGFALIAAGILLATRAGAGRRASES